MSYNRPKILFYIDVMYRGGAQRVMSVLINHFLKRNFDIILITDFPAEDKSKEYIISNKVKRFYLKNNNNGSVIKKNFFRIVNLREIVKENNPDIVLSFLGKPNMRMLLATIGSKCKKVVSVRNDPNKEYGSSKIKKIITNILFLLADGCVFQTEDASKYFWKSTRKKAKIIFNPVDDKFYNIKSAKNKKDIITIGRLEKQKNHRLLIDAFKTISLKFPDDKLIIYGDGSLRQELENYVKEKKLSKQVKFSGNIDNIEEKLGNAKLFILSSDYEGMPNALMEAMASGIAVISTDCPCGGPRALIKSEEQGILIPCNDKNALANAIIKMLKKDYIEIGKNARLRSEEFRTDKILKKWEDYLLK